MKANSVSFVRAIKAIITVLLFVISATVQSSAQTVIKQLYLSDPAQSLDRVDPAGTADATTAQTTGLIPTSQYIYALRGGSRTDFWRYDIAANSWSAMAATPATVTSGGALTSNGTYIYAFKGGTTDFWRYDPAANSWSAMAAAPLATGAGAALVHINGFIYAFRGGNSNTFWKYNIVTNAWSTLATAPANVTWGGALSSDGSDIYATRGAATNTFWKYNIITNTWSTLANVPQTVAEGGSLSFDGTYIYALRGSGANNFYQYNRSSNTWTSLTNTSNTVSRGGSLLSDDPNEYALRGGGRSDFWKYNGSWNAMASTPSAVDSGGAIIKFGTVGTRTTFTQATGLCSQLIIKAGTITVTTYVSVVYGTMPVNPSVTATIRYGTTNIITLSNPVYNSTAGTLTWTGTLGADVSVAASQQISLDITTTQTAVSFKIEYDSQTKPSKIDLPVSTYINVTSLGVYNLAYPAGIASNTVTAGTTRYIRATATDPFGNSDITGMDFTIAPAGTTITGTSVFASGCSKTFENSWVVPVSGSSFTVTATAKEGYENTVTNSRSVTVTTCVACPPSANEDVVTGNGGEPLDIDVLANDSDPNGNMDASSLNIITYPRNGDVIIDNNKITYLPNGTFAGNDTLTYEVCDNSSPAPLCATARVIITINPITFNTCADASESKIYYMPYAENQAQVSLQRSASVWLSSTNVRTIISIKVSYPGMTLVWDHWEDGYETNITTPTQTTTEIWGDGNLFNGAAPGYPTDVLPVGASIVLDNTMPTPRVAANRYYDGMDKLYASGQVSVTQVCGEPSSIAVQCMKTNVAAYPSDFGELFILPVGQNLPSRDFRYTSLFVRAAQNNTYVQIDRDNDGSFETNFTLNEGEVMLIDSLTTPAGTKVNAGAVITSDKPIGVDAHFAGIDNFSSREVPIYPATWYSNTYYTPVPTTGPSTGVADTAVVMLYNSLNRDININWSSGTPSSGTILLKANSSERFVMPLSASAAYKFVNPTKESFVALEIVDSYTPVTEANDGATRDWAFNLISEARLTDFASVAWAPGSTDMTRNDNPIWITPTANTTVYVKFDGDVLNGSNTSPCGLKYDVAYPVNQLSHIRIKDSTDNNQSGAAVYTCNGAKIAAVYGEDPSTALTANPSWDVGSTIQPFCKEKLILANDDYAVTMTNTAVTINILKNDAGFLAIIDPRTVSTDDLLMPQHGRIYINKDGTIIYVPATGFNGVDSFEYQVCSTPSPVVCDIAKVYVTISGCPSPSGQNVIAGQVFLDKNGDGNKNDGGTGLYPAKIYLYVDGNCNNSINTNELVDSTTADINGNFQFIKAPEKTIADNFDLAAGGNSCASGTDGNTGWKSDWYDNNDPSGGFCVTPAQSAGNTDVEMMQDSIFSTALRLDDANRYAIREFNMQNATRAFLSFSFRRASPNFTAGENILVQLSSDGSTYNTIYSIPGTGTYNTSYTTVANISINVATYNGNNKTYLRFATSNNTDEGDNVFIDNVTLRFLQYDQCYIVAIDPASIPSNTTITTVTSKSFTFNSSGTCNNTQDFGVKRIFTYSVNDENSTWQNMSVSGIVMHNDFDQEGNTQTFGSFLNPTSYAALASGSVIRGTDKTGGVVGNAGKLNYTGTGSYTFVPAATFTGTVTVPYKVCDNGSPSACDTALLVITVDPLPGAGNSIIANNDEDVSYGNAISGNLFANDRDPKNLSFSTSLFTYDSNGDAVPDVTTTPGTVTVAGLDMYNNPVGNAGTLSITAGGNYTFTPTSGFTGIVRASYTITNSAGSSTTASVHFEVLSDANGLQNDPPFAGDDFAITSINKPVTASFIGNDRDSNGDGLSMSGIAIGAASSAAIGSPVATNSGGTVQFYANGNYTYTPPAGFTGADYVQYSICDVTTTSPQPLCANAILHFLVMPGISISGKVWTDANGDIVDQGASEPETNANGTLYINLVDAGGYVVATSTVAANGSYSFSDVAPGNNYSLVLSTINGIIGSAAPVASLPSGWTNTGENRNGIIDYGSLGVIDNRAYGYTDVVNLDFGIEELPTSVPFYVNIDQPAVGQIITLNGGLNPPVLSGKDPEDCFSGCTLDNRNLVIDSIPNNSNLYYNGVLVTPGQMIINFDPNKLTIEFTTVTIGTKMTQFHYSFVDAAGKKDPAPALYSINWLTLLPATGLELNANRSGKDIVLLNWKTISEINSDYFEIERSVDGRNYTTIGAKVKAAGNSNTEKTYNTSDNIAGLQAPVIYYRVNLRDVNGKRAYSNQAIVKLAENGAVIRVSPNPFLSDITVSAGIEKDAVYAIRILDIAGRVVNNVNQRLTQETPVVTIHYLSRLVKGVYLLEVTDTLSGKKQVFKIEKAN